MTKAEKADEKARKEARKSGREYRPGNLKSEREARRLAAGFRMMGMK